MELRDSMAKSYYNQISIFHNTIHKTRQTQTKPNWNKNKLTLRNTKYMS